MTYRNVFTLTTLGLLAVSAAAPPAIAESPAPSGGTALFQRQGDDWCRLPSIAVTPKGTVLVFCGKRKGSLGDFGHPTDVILRRSTDGGDTYRPESVIASAAGADIHSGPVVIDRRSGRIFKFCRYWPAEGKPKDFIYETPYPEMVELGWIDHVMTSDDDGRTWTEPKRLPLPYPDDAVSCGTGNGIHGIQLRSGRLLIQGGFARHDGGKTQRFMCLFLSDDGGETWRRGATMPHSAIREFTLAQLADGSVYYNFRNSAAKVFQRWVGWSESPGEAFPELELDPQLHEPWCHAGLAFAAPSDAYPQGVLLFSNPCPKDESGQPAGKQRRDLTIRASLDGGRTWPIARQINDRGAGYSDLATDGQTVHCLYEAGDKRYSERIEYVRLSLEELLQ